MISFVSYNRITKNLHFIFIYSSACAHGYHYDKTWYERTTVSDQDWICDRTLYQTNAFVFHRIGEVVGTFFFGQLGDT